MSDRVKGERGERGLGDRKRGLCGDWDQFQWSLEVERFGLPVKSQEENELLVVANCGN